MKQLFVAEVKIKSPYGFASPYGYNELLDIAIKHGDIVSIHTDIRWGGSMELIRETREKTIKPILAKGIHSTDDQISKALEYGANWVLVVGRVPNEKLLSFCWIEPNSISDIKNIPKDSRLVWNARNLWSNGRYKEETWEEVRKVWKGWICQASFIHEPGDVEIDSDAFIVGASLVHFKNLWLK